MPASPLIERISHQLLALIQSGEIKAGAHLSVPKLAEQFGLSRSPIRQAMLLLQAQQVLQQQPNRGFFVTSNDNIEITTTQNQSISTLPDAPAAYYQLAEDWLQDNIDAEISEQALIRRYQLSRAQLQQILMRGVSDGWIERKSGYGWRLLPVAKTKDALAQLFRFRMTIESSALLEPGFMAPADQIQSLRQLMQHMLDGGIELLTPYQLQLNGYRFHETIIRFSRNVFFEQALRTVNRQRLLLDYRTMCDREHFYQEVRDHLHLLDLIEQGHLAEAALFMKQHLLHSAEIKSQGF